MQNISDKLCTNASTPFYRARKQGAVMSEEPTQELTYMILTPALQMGIAPGFAEHMDAWMEQCLDGQFRALESEQIIMNKDEKGVLSYECDLGFVVVESLPEYCKRFSVVRNTTHPDSAYAAGRLTLALMDTIERHFFTKPYATTIGYRVRDRVRTISDLVEVSVDVKMGKEHKVITKYAIPLHYGNRTRIPESEATIAALEKEIVASLTCPGRQATVRTRVAKRWDAHRGVLAGFFPTDKKTEYARTRLYHHTRIIVPDVVHAGTSLQSDAAQSP